MVNDLVRERPHQHPPGRSTGANSRADLRAFCNQRHRGGDSVEELGSKSASTLLVPVNRFGELFRGGLDTAELTRHRPRMSLSMRRFTSSQGSSRAVPDSIAATRRWISVAHAASASGSAGPSRLASISAASSARASTSSRRASARTASAALVMAVILPRVSPPNKRVNLTVRSVTCPVMAAGRASPARRLRAALPAEGTRLPEFAAKVMVIQGGEDYGHSGTLRHASRQPGFHAMAANARPAIPFCPRRRQRGQSRLGGLRRIGRTNAVPSAPRRAMRVGFTRDGARSRPRPPRTAQRRPGSPGGSG